MMEATTRNLLGRPITILALLSCIFFSHLIHAQSHQPDSRLSQLLDSAEVLKLKMNYKAASQICNEVKNEAEKVSDWAHVAGAYNELASISRYLREFVVCQQYLSKAEEIIFTHLDTLHLEMARNLFYQGRLKRYNGFDGDGYPLNVFSAYHRAETILNRLGGHPKELALVWLDLGRFYDRNDSSFHARRYFSQLEHLLKDEFGELDYIRGFCLYYLGEYYDFNADYERAILNRSLAKYIFSHPLNQDITRSLRSEMSRANIYYNTDQFESAIVHYKQVLGSAQEHQIQDFDELLSVYSNLGRAYFEVDNIDSSFHYSKKAFSINRRLNENEKKTLSRTQLNLGLAYSAKGSNSIAEKYFKEALKLRINLSGEKNYTTHVFYRNIGSNYMRRNLLDDALENYQKALIALFPDFNSKNVYDEPPYKDYDKKENVLYVLTEKAEALYNRYLTGKNTTDLNAAFNLYKILYQLSDDLLNSGMMDESMIQIFLGFKKAFNLSIECAFDIYNETNDNKYYQLAFQFIEKSRYILLQKALISSMYKTEGGVNSELFLQERQLDHDISELKYRIANTEKAQLVFNDQNSLFDKLVDKADITERINVDFKINKKEFMDSVKLTMDEIQDELVKENELIIEYCWAENYIYALTFSKLKNELFKISISPELMEQINIYANSISGEIGFGGSREEFNNYVSAASYLYTELLDPIFTQFKEEKESINKVTLVPDGYLSYLPFESLLTEFPDTTNIGYWSLPYLLKEVSISYAYSLNILRNNLKMSQQIEKPDLLAFSYSANIDEYDDLAYLRSQDEIRYSAEELNSIQSVIKSGDYYEDKEATEALFKAKAANYSLIHLALHGQADVADKYNSNLIFKDDSTSTEDGELHAYELYNLDLSNTEMAVLSACETGIGMQTEGEGIFSIARGFAFAGCPSIFMSLWKVSDKTTATIMEHFYRNLAKGMPKDIALQQAKLSFIKGAGDSGSHPANWAAFIAMGNNQPIQLPEAIIHWYYVITVIIALLVVISFLYLRRKRRNILS